MKLIDGKQVSTEIKQNIKVEVLDELIQRLEALAEVATEDDGWIDIRLQEPIDTQRVIVPNDE